MSDEKPEGEGWRLYVADMPPLVDLYGRKIELWRAGWDKTWIGEHNDIDPHLNVSGLWWRWTMVAEDIAQRASKASGAISTVGELIAWLSVYKNELPVRLVVQRISDGPFMLVVSSSTHTHAVAIELCEAD